MNASTLSASHCGVVRFGDLDCEAVVLTTGERGYVRKQVAKLLGVHENNTGHRFRQILADFSPNSLSELDKFESPISLPSGRRAQFFPAGVITQIASGVIDAALDHTLHRARRKLVPNCMKIMRALATTGEVALIDEIRVRKGISQKHHQWLSEQGLARLESQIHAVTAIARSSMSYADFKRRCESAFAGTPLQLGLLAEELAEVA